MTVLALAAGAVLVSRGSTQRDTAWTVVESEGSHLQVPYDARNADLPAYSADTVDTVPALRFGRVVNAGTYYTREYLLYARPAATVPALQMSLSYGCAGAVPAIVVMMGGREAVRYGVGGAKGCSLGHAFTVGARTYFLTKIPAIGQPIPEPDKEMLRIISSVQEPDQ